MQEAISVENLVQKAGKRTLLDNVSFNVASGEVFGLFGNQGAGKTSLLHVIAGIERFTSGSVKVFGYDIRKSESFKKEFGLVTQKPSLFPELSGEENLDFIASLKGVKGDSAGETAERLELKGHLKERAARLEPGVYKRLSLACALLGGPRLLLVDDLDSSLDLYSLDLVMKELRYFISQGGTGVFVFNSPDLCGVADRAGWLEEGRLSLVDPSRIKNEWENRLDKILERSSCHENQRI